MQVGVHAGMALWQRLGLGKKLLGGSSELEALLVPLPNLSLREWPLKPLKDLRILQTVALCQMSCYAPSLTLVSVAAYQPFEQHQSRCRYAGMT